MAILFFSMIATQGMFSVHENFRPVVKIEPEDNLTVFTSEKAQGTKVEVKINGNPEKLVTIKSTDDSLFSYFIDKCYLDKSPGCKKDVNLIVNDRLAKPGKAIICRGSISGVKITISGKNVGEDGLDSPVAVALSAEPSCSLKENTIYISSKDAKSSNIKLNRKKEGEGYISPFLGSIIPE